MGQYEICLVIVGHFVTICKTGENHCGKVFVYIYTFHMPAFIFVSGMFSKSTINKDNIKFERVVTFLILYVAYKLVKYIEYNYFLNDDFSFHLFIASDLSWYLLCMAIWICMTFLIKKIKPHYVMIIAIILAVMIGFDSETNEVIAIERAFVYWPFFLIGYYLDKDKLLAFLNKKTTRIIGVLVFIGMSYYILSHTSFLWYVGRLMSGHNSYSSIAETYSDFRWWMRIIYYAYVSMFIFGFMSIIPRCKIPVITKGGARTLAIYFIHMFIIYVLKYFNFFNIVKDNYPNSYTIIVVVSAVVLAFILSIKIFSIPFDWLMKRKYLFLFKNQSN